MDAASCTAIRLQWTLASLLVMCTIGFIMSPAVPGILFIILIAIGLVGVRRRHVGLLKFYWTVQILFLVLIVFLFVFLLVLYYSHKGPDISENLAMEGVFFILFVIVLVLKVRSIVLAQRLCTQLESLPYAEENELANVAEESSTQDSNLQPIYVIPQPMFAAPQMNTGYPGAQNNLIPIYVDSYGNPIIQSNVQTSQV